MNPRMAAFALCIGISPLVQAQVSVAHAWVRATVAAQKTTGAYMEIRSRDDASVTGVRSPAAKLVELHETKIEDNVMKMRAVGTLALPAGKTVQLKPGGYHIMMADLVRPLRKGDVVPILLTVEGKDRRRQIVEVKAEVREIAARATSQGH